MLACGGSSLVAASAQQQVAARLIVGYCPQWRDSTSALNQLLRQGVGGVILFRHDVEAYHGEAGFVALAQEMDALRRFAQPYRATDQPPLWVSVDQEGGQIERLPQTLFPSGSSPAVLGQPWAMAQQQAERQAVWQALGLATLGILLNFAPTLDVNLDVQNPVIGVRAYGATPETVSACGQQVLAGFARYGVRGCVKHFPGHGFGQVDSHEQLPTLNYTPQEASTFEALLSHTSQPWVMVSHGYYPVLQGDIPKPASLSPCIIQQYLREKLGFEGVVITDDLDMGALTQATEEAGSLHARERVATLATLAGADVLLYRTAEAVHVALIEALAERWQHPEHQAVWQQHQRSVQRLMKEAPQWPALPVTPPTANEIRHAYATLNTLANEEIQAFNQGWLASVPRFSSLAQAALPTTAKPWWVCLPHPSRLPHYGWDTATGNTWGWALAEQFRVVTYDDEAELVEQLLQAVDSETLSGILLATWLPKVGGQAYQQLVNRLSLRETPVPWVHVLLGWQAEALLQKAGHPQTTLPLHTWRGRHQHLLQTWLA
ncbi:MAG: glycoside hydrolase family 3 N-terminal domain-containing protein [Vampirovibrionales bacterium]